MNSDRKSLASSEAGVSLRNTFSVSGKEDGSEKKEIWGARHTFAFMGFLGFSAMYGMRVNLSVAIVAMVAQNTSSDDLNDTSALACPLPDDAGDDGGFSQPGEFDWSEKTQGLILGSFYWGYACTNLLAGVAAERFGGRLVAGWGILITSLLTLLTPLAARTSDVVFISLRVAEGMAEAASFPSVNSLVAAWVLPEERSKYSAFIYAGVQFGTVVTLAASGYMCDSTFLGGWPSVFYVFGALGVIWSLCWFPLVYDTPAQHPRISQQELEFLKPITYLKTSTKTQKTPWKSIWTSKPVWAIVVVHFGYNWVFYTLLTELPTYLDKIQHFNLGSNGLLSALPYAIMYIYSLLHSMVMDVLTKNKTLSLVNVRRIAMGFATFIPAVALVGMCFVGCDRVTAIIILCIAVGACGACYSGHMCSHVDLAPCYAGILMGLTNTFGTIPGFLSPALTGVITNDNQTLKAWQTVFLLSAVISTVAGAFYVLVISADIQPWNYFNDNDHQQAVVSADVFDGNVKEGLKNPNDSLVVFGMPNPPKPQLNSSSTTTATAGEKVSSSQSYETKASIAESDLSQSDSSDGLKIGSKEKDPEHSLALEATGDGPEQQNSPSTEEEKRS